jgi:hypothetical protein
MFYVEIRKSFEINFQFKHHFAYTPMASSFTLRNFFGDASIPKDHT